MMDGTIISKYTAQAIFSAHLEIERAHELKKKIEEAWGILDADGNDDGPRFQFGIPMSSSSHRLIQVSPALAPYVIDAHIADQQKRLAQACVAAKMELDGIVPTEPVSTNPSA